MFLKFCNEKKYFLVVLILALSHISEVVGWEWFNYWSYQLCREMPWYKQLPWAISLQESLAYRAKRARRFNYNKYYLRRPVTVPPPPSTLGAESAEDTAAYPDDNASSEPGTRRRYGPSPLDLEQQWGDEAFII